MRHNRAGRRLGRDMSHRKATMKHLAVALEIIGKFPDVAGL